VLERLDPLAQAGVIAGLSVLLPALNSRPAIARLASPNCF
jgi:hypothetical protein